MSKEKDEMKKNSSKELKFKDFSSKNNRKRTFLSINDNLPLETKPRFYYDYSCISCQKNINLYSTCKRFEGIRNDILWVKCKNCGEYNLPKITVKFGLDFITTKNKAEDFVLHSPYNLKINIKNAVVTHYGMNIDISNFKSQFQALFWNFIWYCAVHNLDYNILLPYSKNVEMLKETIFYNPNRKILLVNFDDSTFKENQNKIERISIKIKEKNDEKKKSPFQNLKQCSAVATVELNKKGEESNEKNNSFEYKEDVGDKNEKNDLESFMNPGLEENQKGEDDEDDKDEQLIKDVEKHNEALFPTSW